VIEVVTPRLKLRQWRDEDAAPFAAMNADPKVMEFFPAPATREASEAVLGKWRAQIATRGWSNWAVEHRESGELIGFTGLTEPKDLPFAPCVEIGWRFMAPHWGQGFATEAARAALGVGFTTLELEEIVSFTSVLNARSEALMKRIGMRDAGEPFDHPRVAAGHRLRPHVLYRMSRADWERA
jgi:RimJ/RimL family protein N-acetyltransferase